MGKMDWEIIQKLGIELQKRGLNIQKDVIVGNSRADIFVVSPTNTTSVIEIKTWEPTIQNQKRASNLAKLYKKASGADNAFIVMPGSFESIKNSYVISLDEIPELIGKIKIKKPKSESRPPTKVIPKPKGFIFVAMPYIDKYDDTFVIAIQSAAIKAGFDAKRVDQESYSGDIVNTIKKLIKSSIAVVADLSESKPNVLYELGYAEALERPTIQICSTPLENLPFDVRNNKTIKYTIGQSSRLNTKLLEEFKEIIPK